MGDKKLRSDIVNLRVVAILAVIFGHSTTIYWYNCTIGQIIGQRKRHLFSHMSGILLC